MLTTNEEQIWASSFANCAIEGNQFAIHMINLWNTNKKLLRQELNKWLEGRS